MLPIEKQIDIQIREACFRIAESIIGYESKSDVFEYQYDLEVLFHHADNFYKHALNEYYYIADFETEPGIFISTLKYIEHRFAIPPLLNDFCWFGDTLHSLLSLFVATQDCNNNEVNSFLDILELNLKNRSNNGKD